MKTQQRFIYKTTKGESKGYLLMPGEYDQCVKMMKELDKPLAYVANWVGLSTNHVDLKTLKLQQTIVGE